MMRGHGPAVYEFGWDWFLRCLRVADEAESRGDRIERLKRAQRAVDLRLAMHGDGKDFDEHVRTLLKE